MLALYILWSCLCVMSTQVAYAKAELVLNDEDFLSCRNKCGQDLSLPCSCEQRCLVYNNCCEDINSECPEIIDESRTKFHSLLQSQIECHYQGFFFIASCPGELDRKSNIANKSAQIINSSSSIGSTVRGDVKVGYSDKSNITVEINSSVILWNIIDGDIVTDTSTGFVFKNSTIFACHATNTSIPVKWDVSLKFSPLQFTPQSLQHLSEFIDRRSSPQYLPPGGLPSNLSVALCNPESIGHCPDDVMGGKKELVDKCEMGTLAYVKYLDKTIGNRVVIYNNKYCGECNLGEHAILWPYTAQRSKEITSAFSVLISLSTSILKVSTGSTWFKTTFPWQEATCELSTDGSSHEKTTCATDCTLNYEKRPDNMCKILTRVKFAIADDDYPLQLHDLEILPKFVSCRFKNNLYMDVVDTSPVVTTMYDTRLKTILYVIELQMFHTQAARGLNPIVPTYKEQEEYLRNMSKISKDFNRIRQQRVLSNVSSPGDGDHHGTSKHGHIRDKPITDNSNEAGTPGLTTYESIALDNLVTNLRQVEHGNETNLTTTTTTCICSYLPSEESNCTLYCFQDYGDDGEMRNVSCPLESETRNHCHVEHCPQVLTIALTLAVSFVLLAAMVF